MIEPTNLPATSLYEKQQQASFIILLGAQKQLYIDAKRIRSIIFFFTLILAIATPIVLHFLPTQEDMLSVIAGVVSIIITLVFDPFAAKKVEQAAKVQEQFDTTLYGDDFPKNEGLVGDAVPEHIIINANSRLKDRGNLSRPWYENYDKLEYNQAVLACQSENLYWDYEQKQKYTQFIWFVGIAVFITFLIWGWVRSLTIPNYLYDIIVPQVGFYTYIYLLLHNSNKAIAALTNKYVYAKSTADTLKKESASIPLETLRKIQDFIFENRKTGVLVPEWYYKRQRKRLQKTLEDTAAYINQ